MTRDPHSIRAAVLLEMSRQGIDQRTLAERAGVDESMVSRYVRGWELRTDTAERLLLALGLEIGRG